MEGKQVGEEGCLSIPGFREQVRRGKRVTVRAQNAKGEEFEMTGEDLLARAFLHETDHLYGRLYITHISALKRDLMKRKIKKLQRSRRLGLGRGMRLVFLGTPAFAVPTLEAIVDGGPRSAGGGHAAGPAARPRAECRPRLR